MSIKVLLKKSFTLTLATTLLLTTGCAGYSNSYKCKPSTGIRCKSIPEINAMIDNGAVGRTSITANTKTKKIANNKQSPSNNATDVIRAPEETMTIFVKAYEDLSGTYHHDNILQVVVSDAYWKRRA